MAMATAVTPIAMAEAGSSSYGNAQIFNSPQLTNESYPLVTSNQGPDHINFYGSECRA